MLLTQEEIDAVLANADAAVQELTTQTGGGTPSAPSGGRTAGGAIPLPSSERVQRILKLHVPVIVRLAQRAMRVSDIMHWGRGTIVEFGQSVDQELDLMVNNRVIGRGEGVKVGEKFGLRVLSVGDAQTRVMQRP